MKNKTRRGVSIKELIEMKMPESVVKIEGGEILLRENPDSYYDYPIEIERVDSYGSIVKWVRHLSEKNWVTTTHLRQFIDVSCKHLGISQFGE